MKTPARKARPVRTFRPYPDHGWKCSSCGYPGELAACPCVTNSIYRRVGGKMEVSVKKNPPMLVDQMCRDLAEHFLAGISKASPQDTRDLAETLQRACDDACRTVEIRVVAPRGRRGR